MIELLADSAVFSPCGNYRYLLVRDLGGPRTVVFAMLNPSTATAEVNDPTVRRCMGFARDWGFGRLVVVNLYAFRATDPAWMFQAAARGIDIVGPENDQHIAQAASEAEFVVAAWGVHATPERQAQAWPLLGRAHCLGVTKGGQPRHPLYIKGSAQPVLFDPVPGFAPTSRC